MAKFEQQEQTLVLKRLHQDNTWWGSKAIPSDYAAMQHRQYLSLFYPLVRDLSNHRAPILMGPRRIGKTVMIFHCIEQLIQDGIPPTKIIYISIDTPIYSNHSLEELFHLATQSLNTQSEQTGYYIFFDEIQYLKDWEVHLKSLVDSYRQCKFVASGSAAATLKMKSRESGAGRFSDFSLPPLTFYEYIDFHDAHKLLQQGEQLKDWACINIEQLNQHFVNYINYGGYPELVFSQNLRANNDRYIRNDIVDKVLLRDLPSLYGISDIQELNRLFMYIAFRSGSEFSYESLSREAGLSKESLKKYLQYLEAAFLIRILHRVDRRAQLMKRITSFKIYLSTTSLYSALYTPIDGTSPQMGDLVETTIIEQEQQAYGAQFYYIAWKKGSDQGEVDLVQFDPARQQVKRCTEIKWSDRYLEQRHELKSLSKFLADNAQCPATVTTISQQGIKQTKNGDILFIPAAIYAYWASYKAYKALKGTPSL